MKKTTELLQKELQEEYALRASFEQNLVHEKRISDDATQVLLELKSKLAEEARRVETLKSQLDSAGIMLEEKEEKLRELKHIIADREARSKVHEMREKEALMMAEGLKEQIILLEEERITEKKNSAVLLEDFNEWRNASEEGMRLI